MAGVARRLLIPLLFVLIPGLSAFAFEPFELFGEPLFVPEVQRVVVDSLVDFDVQIRETDSTLFRMEVIASRRRSQEIFYEEVAGTLRIEQRRRRSLWRFLPRRLLLAVPPGVVVEVRTLTGDVRLDGVDRPVTITTSSGDIEVRSSGGPLEISTASGDIEIDGGEGSTIIRGSSGTVRMGNRSGRFIVETAAGDIAVRNSMLTEASSFLSSAGDIDLRLRNPRDQIRANLETAAGELQLDGTQLSGAVAETDGSLVLIARTASGSIRITTGR